MMRKTDYAFWTFLLMTGLAGATTLLNVSQTYSATPSQNSELYRQLDLFGDVLERVRLHTARRDRRHAARSAGFAAVRELKHPT